MRHMMYNMLVCVRKRIEESYAVEKEKQLHIFMRDIPIQFVVRVYMLHVPYGTSHVNY